MFRDVITADSNLDEWNKLLRPRIEARILNTMGACPLPKPRTDYEISETAPIAGFKVKKLSFEAIPGFPTSGRIVIPECGKVRSPGVLCIHGTDFALAHLNMMNPDERPDRQYAIELARHGFTVLTVDQLGFSVGGTESECIRTAKRFYKVYPDWSLDGARLFIHRYALDILSSLEFVDPDRLACMGHSLGGRASLYLASFDERIKAAVASAAVSPNITNLFRNIPGQSSLSPDLDKAFIENGIPPFEYQELIALTAPRMLLLLEPWNDPYNPVIESVLRCFEKARYVYRLYGKDKNFQIVCHGDGHNTSIPLRSYAYSLMKHALYDNSNIQVAKEIK